MYCLAHHSLHNYDICILRIILLGANMACIGTDAAMLRGNQPTMTLSLGHPDDAYKQHLVRHQFGHVLGLGHGHQSPKAPSLIEKDALILKLAPLMPGNSEADKRKAAGAKYEHDYKQHSVGEDAVVSEFDPRSIMTYWLVQLDGIQYCLYSHLDLAFLRKEYL